MTDTQHTGFHDCKVTKIAVERHTGSWWVALYVADAIVGGWNGPYLDKADAEKTAKANRLSYGLAALK